MKTRLVTGLAPIASSPDSHKGAQGFIYADMLDAHVNHSKGKIENFDSYDEVYLYHGNDFSGNLNLFGGIEKNLHMVDTWNKLARHPGLRSLGIPMPAYGEMFRERLKASDADMHVLDADDVPVFSHPTGKVNTLVIGDSHATSLHGIGSMISVPYQTLYGALKKGLASFVPDDVEYENLWFYFGNIDIRHHLVDHDLSLLAYYRLQLRALNAKCVAPLPIENESRVIPKSGWHKGRPFNGSWAQRNDIRKKFMEEMSDYIAFEWEYLENEDGELDFRHMEKPRSVHLSARSYPFFIHPNDNAGLLI